jgi:hypothetical protein
MNPNCVAGELNLEWPRGVSGYGGVKSAMKRFLVSTALAGALAVCAFSNNASAATVSFSEIDVYSAGDPNAPLYFTPTPVDSLNFIQTESGSSSGVTRSPYENNTDGFALRNYSVISEGGGGAGYATYDLNGAKTINILWGSPDDYNFIAFYDAAGGAGGGGNLISLAGTANSNYITGTDLACYAAGTTACRALHWVEVQFTSDVGIGSIVLSDSGQAAFEYGLPRISNEGELVPIPGALPLFASGLAGLGLLGLRRRKLNAKTA